MSLLPLAPRFASWFAAYADGRTSLDDALDAITADGRAHQLSGLDDDDSTTPLVLGLGRLRAGGVDRVGVSLPAAGDPAGLAGPPPFNVEAVDAGEAVLLGRRDGTGLGLVPHPVGGGVCWQVHEAHLPAPPDVAAADRDLRAALRESADALAALDVARWRPEVADALLDLRRPQELDLPPGVAGGAVALAGVALRCRLIVALARADDGATVSAAETDARVAALAPLDRAARRGLAAACSGPVAG